MNAEHSEGERKIAERARQLFAQSTRGLDGHTRSKLAQARAKAVEAAGSRSLVRWHAPPGLLPLGGVAAAVLAVALIWQSPGPQGLEEPTVLSDLDLLLDGEDFDLYEDLEFYAWLLEQPELLRNDEQADGSG